MIGRAKAIHGQASGVPTDTKTRCGSPNAPVFVP